MIVIIGGGAAGIFTALRIKQKCQQAEVMVLEKTNQLLAKVKISGGGRCNVTHACFDAKQLALSYPRGHKELVGPFHRFTPQDMINWFQEQGIVLKNEPDGRMFPTSDSSQTIIDCFLNLANQLGVKILKQAKIHSLEKTENGFKIRFNDQVIDASHLVLSTGSSKWGHAAAQKLGHHIVDPVPSLFTLNIPSSDLLDLAGITVEKATLTLRNFKKELGCIQTGPLLLTHWGFSGPAALKLSAWAARHLYQCQYQAELQVNWLGDQSLEETSKMLITQKKKTPKSTLKLPLPQKLQKRLISRVIKDPSTLLQQIPDAHLKKLAVQLTQDVYLIEGKTTYKNEFVTAGGVELKEINFKTFESRIVPHLYFTGEILNIDGITGGFNFQNAWTGSDLAAEAIVDSL